MLSVECCDRKWKAAVSSLLTSDDGERRVSLSNTGHHRVSWDGFFEEEGGEDTNHNGSNKSSLSAGHA